MGSFVEVLDDFVCGLPSFARFCPTGAACRQSRSLLLSLSLPSAARLRRDRPLQPFGPDTISYRQPSGRAPVYGIKKCHLPQTNCRIFRSPQGVQIRRDVPAVFFADIHFRHNRSGIDRVRMLYPPRQVLRRIRKLAGNVRALTNSVELRAY